jgi:hypothetical protein
MRHKNLETVIFTACTPTLVSENFFKGCLALGARRPGEQTQSPLIALHAVSIA